VKRFLATLLLAGCVSAPPPAPPVAQGRLAEAEARAAAAVRGGDHAGAARFYEDALRIAISIESPDAVAENAINLSIVQQWLGRDAEARKALATILDNHRAAFPEKRLLQAELRRAIVELALKNPAEAAAWAQRAEKRCGSGCEHAATILNVQAQIALESNQSREAARLAQSAGERARSRSDRAETANALRTLGRARVYLGETAQAIDALRQAFAIDRDLADPRKIFADLTELSRASAAAGDRQSADDYRDRAIAVGRALNDGRSITEIEAQVRRP